MASEPPAESTAEPLIDPNIHLSGYVLIFPSPTGTGALVSMWAPTESGTDALIQKYGWKHAVKMSAQEAYAAILAASKKDVDHPTSEVKD